jgi:hypothetical protein
MIEQVLIELPAISAMKARLKYGSFSKSAVKTADNTYAVSHKVIIPYPL